MIGDVAKRPGTAGEPTTVELDAGDRLSIWPTSPAPDVRTPTNSSGSPDAGDACVVIGPDGDVVEFQGMLSELVGDELVGDGDDITSELIADQDGDYDITCSTDFLFAPDFVGFIRATVIMFVLFAVAGVVFVVGLVVLVIGLGRRQPPAPRYL